MTTPGDDDYTPSPPSPPPDPTQRFGIQTPPLSQSTDPAPDATSKARDLRRGLMAPIAAGLVLIGGVGLLIVRSGSDESEASRPPRIAEVRDPEAPRVDTTVPRDSVVGVSVPVQTSPPFIEPTTTVDDGIDSSVADETTTSSSSPTSVAPGGPTLAQLDAALLGLDDIGPGGWTEEVPEFDEVCGTVPNEEVTDARADSLFQMVIDEPFGVRQISNTLVTFPTAEIAELAFNGDVALLVACNATTIDLDGIQYRVQVDSDSFTEAQSAEFPCADQSAFLIVQLTNESALVPYIGQSAASFRCGRNITVTALTTTIDIDDLNDEDFFDAAGSSNIRTGALPGS